jgi:RNA polymerase sigma-70 factor (ECF subfamily)
MNDNDRDRQLVERMRAGDAAALEALYDRHSPLAYSMILRIVGGAADAEEVLQEAWLQAWRRADTYDEGRGTVIGWLLNIARSRAIDRLRSATSRRRMESRVEAEPIAAASLPDDEAELRRLGQRVREALVALGPPHSEVLELAYFGGLSQSEIAGRLGAPLGTVKSWTRQALLRLKERFPAESSS